MAGARACVSVAAALQGCADEEWPGRCFLAHGEWVCVSVVGGYIRCRVLAAFGVLCGFLDSETND